MSRGFRLAIGLTTAGVLLVVSLVAVVVGAVLATGGGSFFPSDPGFYAGYDFSGRADAEVLDVDDEGPWTWVDVRFDTGDEVVVTALEWTEDPDPQVGDTVSLAYDPFDPEYGVIPVAELGDVTGEPDSSAPLVAEPGGPLPTGAVAAFWTAGVTGALALVAVVLTLLWSSRAPAGERAPHQTPYAYAPGAAYQPSPAPVASVPAQPYRPPAPGHRGWNAPPG